MKFRGLTTLNGTVEVEIYECSNCGYHFGIDGTFSDQVRDVIVQCPSCGLLMDTVDPENEDRDDDRFWESNIIQFARLLAEADSSDALKITPELLANMNCGEDVVKDILTRAVATFSQAKVLIKENK